jgi:mRNA interferase MazF
VGYNVERSVDALDCLQGLLLKTIQMTIEDWRDIYATHSSQRNSTFGMKSVIGVLIMKRGEIRWCLFRSPDKRRPVLILTRDTILPYLTSITVAPLTTTIRDIPSQVLLTPNEDGVNQECVVNLDQIQTVERSALGNLVVQLSPQRMQEVAQAVIFALGLEFSHF